MKTVSILLGVFLFIIATTIKITAQESASIKPNYPLTIPEVGNCSDWASCRKLCKDPINTSACYQWAQKEGYVKPKDQEISPQVLQEASLILGCSTLDACKVICNNPANFASCDAFSKKHKLTGGFDKVVFQLKTQIAEGKLPPDLQNMLRREMSRFKLVPTQTLEQISDLSDLCSYKVNSKQCQKIASLLGFIEPEKKRGPGGCLTDDSCRRFCDDPNNIIECQKADLSGPKGCLSQTDCWLTCQEDPHFCKNTQILSDVTNFKSQTKQVYYSQCWKYLSQTDNRPVKQVVSELKKFLPHCEFWSKQISEKTSCSLYLQEQADKPLDFQKLQSKCAIVVLPPNYDSLKLTLNSDGTLGQDSYQRLYNLCSDTAQELSDQEIVSQSHRACQTFAQSLQTLRRDCSYEFDRRPPLLQNDQNYARFCLSVPSDITEYSHYCQEQPEKCKEGFDWYCRNYPGKCQSILDGRPAQSWVKQGFIKRWGNSWSEIERREYEYFETPGSITIVSPSIKPQVSIPTETKLTPTPVSSTLRGITNREWNGTGWNGINWNGANWNGINWNGVDWNGINWNGNQWNGINWNAYDWNEPVIISPTVGYPSPTRKISTETIVSPTADYEKTFFASPTKVPSMTWQPREVTKTPTPSKTVSEYSTSNYYSPTPTAYVVRETFNTSQSTPIPTPTPTSFNNDSYYNYTTNNTVNITYTATPSPSSTSYPGVYGAQRQLSLWERILLFLTGGRL